MCATVYNWRHLVIATEVAGLAKTNGNLLPGGWLKVICGLTAYTLAPESAPGSTLGNEYGRTLPLTLNFRVYYGNAATE